LGIANATLLQTRVVGSDGTLFAALGLFARPEAARVYITPVHTNALIVGYAFNDGSILFGNVLPITNASGRFSVPNLSFYHTLSFFKRSANLTATLPYAVGTFKGEVQGNRQQIYRSGLADSVFRFSVNLLGGPAMDPKDFVKWKRKRILGASIQMVAPTGQYYSSHLINPGNNRWAFKPELGYSDGGGTGSWMPMEESGYSPRTTII
jgi:hypothetical protein